MERTGKRQILLSINKEEYKSECDSGVFSNSFELKIEQNSRFHVMDVMFFLVVNCERQLHPRKKIFLQPHFTWNDPRNHFFSCQDPGLKLKVIQSRDRNPMYFKKFLFSDAKSHEQEESIQMHSQHFLHNCNFLGKIPCSDYQSAGKKSSSYLPLMVFYLHYKEETKQWFVKKQQISFKMSSTNKEIDDGIEQMFEQQPISVPQEYLSALLADNYEVTAPSAGFETEQSAHCSSEESFDEVPTPSENPIMKFPCPEPSVETFGPFSTMEEAKKAFLAKRLDFLQEIEKFQQNYESDLEIMKTNYNKRPQFWQHWSYSGNKHKRKRDDSDISSYVAAHNPKSSTLPILTAPKTAAPETQQKQVLPKPQPQQEATPIPEESDMWGIRWEQIDDNTVRFNDTVLMEIPPEKMLRFENHSYDNYMKNCLLSQQPNRKPIWSNPNAALQRVLLPQPTSSQPQQTMNTDHVARTSRLPSIGSFISAKNNGSNFFS